ncbi:MAG: hypothetical protein NTW96_03325 [Planctomycetia bacterium]|nr:hypothetical protein [Planctomycetia bacterium]
MMHRTRQPPHGQVGASVWHAEDLDVDALFASHGRRVAEGVLWFGHCVYTGLTDDARCREAGRVPLKTEYLRNVIGRHHVDDVRQAAVEVGYVQRDSSYRAGRYSQAYWILPPYDSVRLVQRDIADPGLRHNVRKWHQERRRAMWQRIQRNETLVDSAVCQHLWRNLQRLRIDAQIDFGEVVCPAYQIAAERIRHRELWFTVDDYGRIHTNVTNLPRQLRRRLSADGVRLANVDIGESQPLFIGMAIAKATAGRQPVTLITDDSQTRFSPRHHMMDNTMMDKNTLFEGELDREQLPDALRRYVELCEARGLYQTVADRLGQTRDEAKRRVMVVFFDKPWHSNAVSDVLEALFPTVMETMRRIKRTDYRRLAHLAQRIENAFMFRRIVPRIIQERPDLFITTIHDSILTTVGTEDYIRETMRDEFARLGLSPQVKVEPC